MYELFSPREGLFHKDLHEILHAGAEITVVTIHIQGCVKSMIFFVVSCLLDFLFECKKKTEALSLCEGDSFCPLSK